MRDCFFLVADKTMEQIIAGVAARDRFYLSLGCCPFDLDPERDVKVAVGKNDPGLYLCAAELLSPWLGEYKHAIVMLDAEWDGAPSAIDQKCEIERRLHQAGWSEDCVAAIVVEPEIDEWLWTGTIHTARALNWQSYEELETFLRSRGFLREGEQKPSRPKEAAQIAIREKRKPFSSAIHRYVAEKVSISRYCVEPGLCRLVETMRRWFPEEAEEEAD
jgi:hypothetical protein